MERILAHNDDFSNISNRISNENAEEERADNRDRTRTSLQQQVDGEAAAVQERIAANRRAYEQGLREEQAIKDRRNAATETDTGKSSDTKSAGKVLVSFSLSNPVRYSDDLFVPGYQCRGGGEIIISITVNRNGRVISATPKQASASVDDCMTETAINAAMRSRFDVNGSAPDKQQGTITYVFMPQ